MLCGASAPLMGNLSLFMNLRKHKTRKCGYCLCVNCWTIEGTDVSCSSQQLSAYLHWFMLIHDHALATETLRRGLKWNTTQCQNRYQQIKEGVNPGRRNGLNNAVCERLCCVLLETPGSHRKAVGAGRTTQPVLGWCFHMSYRCIALTSLELLSLFVLLTLFLLLHPSPSAM